MWLSQGHLPLMSPPDAGTTRPGGSAATGAAAAGAAAAAAALQEGAMSVIWV
jgi:hypothetical protein